MFEAPSCAAHVHYASVGTGLGPRTGAETHGRGRGSGYADRPAGFSPLTWHFKLPLPVRDLRALTHAGPEVQLKGHLDRSLSRLQELWCIGAPREPARPGLRRGYRIERYGLHVER